MTFGARSALKPPKVEDTVDGNNGTRSLDANTWFVIRRALSPGVFRCARGVVSLDYLIPSVRIHSHSGTPPQGISPHNGCSCVGCCANRCVCNLSVVPRYAPAGDDRSRDVSATPAYVEPHDHGLALAWDGVEGARRLVRSHLDHDGRVCLHPVWPRPQEPSETTCCGTLFCRGFVCCCRDRGLLRRDD